MFQSFESASQIISSIVNSKPTGTRGRKKLKLTEAHMSSMPSRPKMIHTQKTRVPVDAQGDGRGRHKTKTLITRTTPAEHLAKDKDKEKLMQNYSGERNRPRTKNVSYHVLQAEKLPLATFPDEEIDQNRNGGQYHIQNESGYDSIAIKPDPDELKNHQEIIEMEYQTVETEIPDVANEETILAHVEDDDYHVNDDVNNVINNNDDDDVDDDDVDIPVSMANEIAQNQIQIQNTEHQSQSQAQSQSQSTPVSMIKVTKSSGKRNNSLTPGRHIIGPGNKVIRIVKGGMLVSNKIKKEPELLVPDIDNSQQLLKHVKQEIVEPSPLHELAELSMQHAQNMFRCEMCSATFTDRSQLLMHVPVHI